MYGTYIYLFDNEFVPCFLKRSLWIKPNIPELIFQHLLVKQPLIGW